MANEIIAARYVKHPTTAVSGVTHFRINRSTVEVSDPGEAGTTGRQATRAVSGRINIEVYGHSYAALLTLLDAAAANAVLGYQDAGGNNRKITAKNAKGYEILSDLEIPAKDSGGKIAEFGVRLECLGGTEDTWATMLVDAADA